MSISNLLTSGAQAGADLSITCHNVICDAESVFEAGLRVDNIAEYTADNGVSIDGVLLKNGGLTCGALTSGTASMIGAPVNGIDLCNKDYVDAIAGGGGDVVGAGVSVDNAITRYDGATGKLIQSSVATLGDTGVINTGGYYTSTNTDVAAAITATNSFLRGTGFSASGWVSLRCGATSAGAGADGNKIVMGNNNGACIIAGHDNSSSTWTPLQIGEDSAGAITTIKGSTINLTNTTGVAVSSATDAVSALTGSLRVAGGVGIWKALWVNGLMNVAGKSTMGGDLTLGTEAVSAHIITKGPAPTISATHTIQSWSTDTAGEITVAASSTATITFGVAFTSMLGLTVVLTPKTAGAGAYYVGATSTTTFTVVNVVASPITFMYHVIACY